MLFSSGFFLRPFPFGDISLYYRIELSSFQITQFIITITTYPHLYKSSWNSQSLIIILDICVPSSKRSYWSFEMQRTHPFWFLLSMKILWFCSDWNKQACSFRFHRTNCYFTWTENRSCEFTFNSVSRVAVIFVRSLFPFVIFPFRWMDRIVVQYRE